MENFKNALIFAWHNVTSNWIALLIFICCGVIMAIKGNEGFIIGVGIGLAICYVGSVVYKLIKN